MNAETKLYFCALLFVLACIAFYVSVKTKLNRNITVIDTVVLVAVFSIVLLFDFLVFYAPVYYIALCFCLGVMFAIMVTVGTEGKRYPWYEYIVMVVFGSVVAPIVCPVLACAAHFKWDK